MSNQLRPLLKNFNPKKLKIHQLSKNPHKIPDVCNFLHQNVYYLGPGGEPIANFIYQKNMCSVPMNKNVENGRPLITEEYMKFFVERFLNKRPDFWIYFTGDQSDEMGRGG